MRLLIKKKIKSRRRIDVLRVHEKISKGIFLTEGKNISFSWKKKLFDSWISLSVVVVLNIFLNINLGGKPMIWILKNFACPLIYSFINFGNVLSYCLICFAPCSYWLELQNLNVATTYVTCAVGTKQPKC